MFIWSAHIVCFLTLVTSVSLFSQSATREHLSHREIITSLGNLITENYVFPEVAQATSDDLIHRLNAGEFDSIHDIDSLARHLTRVVRKINHDRHMRVMSTRNVVPTLPRRNSNAGFAEARLIDGHIGYIDMRGFVQTRLAIPRIDSIMRIMERADALIIDLRRNGGGSPETVQYFCSYFFDSPVHLNSLYWRNSGETEEFWTRDINGKKRPELPLYVLTSNYTFSGAEEFAYNMLTRDRAVLIGEVTGGGANPGQIFKINADLEVFIPTGTAVNPVTGTNWEGTGVTPDILTDADTAMEKALELISSGK